MASINSVEVWPNLILSLNKEICMCIKLLLEVWFYWAICGSGEIECTYQDCTKCPPHFSCLISFAIKSSHLRTVKDVLSIFPMTPPWLFQTALLWVTFCILSYLSPVRDISVVVPATSCDRNLWLFGCTSWFITRGSRCLVHKMLRSNCCSCDLYWELHGGYCRSRKDNKIQSYMVKLNLPDSAQRHL